MKIILQTLLCFLIITQLQAQCQEQDYITLRALYLNTSGDNWTNNDNWLDSLQFINNPVMPLGTDVGTWYGVTTDADGCVTCIDMDGNPDCAWPADGGNNLTGRIPAEIGMLSKLGILRLRDNQLSGSIPSQIGDLTNLTYLGLVRNEISGEIPPEIFGLTNLESLSLGANNLVGNIPPDLATLNKLSFLNLAYNELSGIIPPELSQLSNLEILWLSSNQFNGSIPPELSLLTNLDELFLSDNQLNGAIPIGLSNLTKLIKLDLSDNQLTGIIPSEIGNLSNLTYLRLSNNQLEGCYASDLAKLCTQFTPQFPIENDDISDGNNFDATWEDFCATGNGVCIASSTYPTLKTLDISLINSIGEAPILIYTLKKSGDINISLYNMFGQKFLTNNKARSDTGVYQMELETADLPKGMYLIFICFKSYNGSTEYKTIKLMI